MKQIKTLIKKEWWTHWTTLLIPTWFSLGVVVISLIGYFWALSKGSIVNPIMQAPRVGIEFDKLVLWGMGIGGSTILAFIAMISGISLGDAMLNGGNKRRCDIFHLSQPVSLARIVGVKYAMITLGLYLQAALISLIGISVVGPYVASLLRISPAIAYTGVLQGLAAMFLPFLFVNTFFWMFSAIFRHAAFIKAVLSVTGIEIARGILMRLSGVHFPSLADYLAKLSSIGVNTNQHLTQQTLASMGGVDAVTRYFWSNAFDAYTIQRIGFSILFFIVGYLVFRRREIA